MEFSKYVNGLKKITLEDIKDIINEDLINKTNSVYGFRKVSGVLFFGELLFGMISKPYILICEKDDNLCKEIYNLLQKEFSDNCEYSYEHSFSEGYDYFGTINDGAVTIYFPNYNECHQSWILKQVNSNNTKKR